MYEAGFDELFSRTDEQNSGIIHHNKFLIINLVVITG